MLDDNVTQQYQIRSKNIDFIYKLSPNNIGLQVKTLNSFQMLSSSNIAMQQSASIFSEAFGNANRNIAKIKISVVNDGRECLIERVIPSSL